MMHNNMNEEGRRDEGAYMFRHSLFLVACSGLLSSAHSVPSLLGQFLNQGRLFIDALLEVVIGSRLVGTVVAECLWHRGLQVLHLGEPCVNLSALRASIHQALFVGEHRLDVLVGNGIMEAKTSSQEVSLHLVDVFALANPHLEFGESSADILDGIIFDDGLNHVLGLGNLSYMRGLCVLRESTNHKFVNLPIRSILGICILLIRAVLGENVAGQVLHFQSL